MEVQPEKPKEPAAQAPPAKEEKKEVPEFYESIPILPMIAVAQNQNGLRHKDYQRYQRYCSRKIRKLRKILKLTQGRTKEFIKKEITPEIVKNSKAIMIKIFEVERYWAYGMHLKQKISQSIMDTKHTQKEMKDKFKQAAKASEELLKIIKAKMGTDNTVLEAEAYSQFLKGQALVENDKSTKYEEHLKEALKCMYKAGELYNILQKDKDPLTQILYKEKITQIDPFTRLALYKLAGDNEKTRKMYEDQKIDISKDVKKLVDQVQKEKETKVKSNYIEISYGGKSIPLNTEQLQILYKSIISQQADIEKAKTNPEKIKEYSKVLGTIGKWTEEVKREKAEEFKKSEGSAQLYNMLIDYTNGMKSDIVIKKLQLIAGEQKEKFENECDLTLLIRKRKNPKESALIGKIVILLINIAKKVKQIKNLEKDFIDQKRIAGYEMQERIYKLLLLYYKAIYYALNNKYLEGHYIAQAVIDEAKKAEEFYKVNSSAITVKDRFFDEALNIGGKAKKLQTLVHCVYLMRQKAKKEEKETPEMKKAKRAVKYKDAVKLIKEDGLNSAKINAFIPVISNAPKDLIMPSKPKKYPALADKLNLPDDPKKIRIVNEIPELKSLHVKPYLHDIAGTLVEFPDLDTVIKNAKTKKGGLMNKIKGLFW